MDEQLNLKIDIDNKARQIMREMTNAIISSGNQLGKSDLAVMWGLEHIIEEVELARAKETRMGQLLYA